MAFRHDADVVRVELEGVLPGVDRLEQLDDLAQWQAISRSERTGVEHRIHICRRQTMKRRVEILQHRQYMTSYLRRQILERGNLSTDAGADGVHEVLANKAAAVGQAGGEHAALAVEQDARGFECGGPEDHGFGADVEFALGDAIDEVGAVGLAGLAIDGGADILLVPVFGAAGLLDALLLSRLNGQARRETPYLEFAYQPAWRWKQPPPPPVSRPWGEQ